MDRETDLDLSKNSISEFHSNLMKYYELVEDKHKKARGDLVGIVKRLTLPKFVFEQEKLKDRTMMREYDNGKPRNWGTRREWRDHMLSKGYNTHNTKLTYIDHNNIPTNLLDILDTLPIKYPIFSLNIQPPGSVIPAHTDTWRIWLDKYPELGKKYTFEDTKFFVVFLTPQEVGHFFQCGTTSLQWEAGAVAQIPYYVKHATANAGFSDKILVQCLGIKDEGSLYENEQY